MKRLAAAAILLVLVIVTLFCGEIAIEKQCGEFSNDMSLIENDVQNEDMQSAVADIGTAREKWQKRKEIISAFSNHSPLDDISISLSELYAAAENSDKTLIEVKCAQINALVGRIIEEERIHFDSFY